MSKRRAILALALVLAVRPGRVEAWSSLFFLELQAVAACAEREAKVVYFSHSRHDAMQKPSLGFDVLLRLSGRSGDWGAVALQVRLAYDADNSSKAELQVYNAYFKSKLGFADLWAGHNRPALGLSSVLDSHAELLQPLTMQGIGFDRDWGFGLSRDFSWGSGGLSLTSGSGMALRFSGNYLAAGRIARGVLSRDNYSLGLSAAYGRVLDVMGPHVMLGQPGSFRCVAFDASHLWRRVENRIEVAAGTSRDDDLFAVFWRGSLRFLEEDRLRIELQPVFVRRGRDKGLEIAMGASFQATAHLSLRAMGVWDEKRNDRRIVIQVYYYRAI